MVLKTFVLVVFLGANLFVSKLRADEPIIGFYAFPKKEYIDKISDTQIKYLIPYGTDGIKDENYLKEFLSYAEKKGIKIIFSLKDSYLNSKWYPKISWCPTDDESKLVKCIVEKFNNYNSVYGWYLADEPTYTIGNKNIIKLDRNYRAVKEISHKPIFIEDLPLPRGILWDKLSDISDILMTGSYPVPEKPLTEVYDVIKSLYTKYKKPIIAVIQTHGKYQYPFYKRDENTGRPPTYDEIRVMSYLSLLAGAKGIIYYSLFDVEKLPDSETRFKMLIETTNKIKKDYNIISSNLQPKNNYKIEADSKLYFTLKTYDNKDFLVVVNPTKSKLPIKISLLSTFISKELIVDSLGVNIFLVKELFK